MSPAYSLYCGTLCAPEQLGLRALPEKPMMALSGVRSSWLIGGEELRLGDVGLLGMAPGFVAHLARFLEFVDQRVLFRPGARYCSSSRRAVACARKTKNISPPTTTAASAQVQRTAHHQQG